jgi:hypothetical protein
MCIFCMKHFITYVEYYKSGVLCLTSFKYWEVCPGMNFMHTQNIVGLPFKVFLFCVQIPQRILKGNFAAMEALHGGNLTQRSLTWNH